jgi:hypothetical protein
MASSMTATTDTGTTVDHVGVSPPRTAFVVQNDDTATTAKAALLMAKTAAGVWNAAHTADYSLAATDLVTITITGDFTGLSRLGYDLDNSGGITTTAGTDVNEVFTVSGSSATLTVNGDRLGNAGAKVFWIKTSSSVLTSPRTFGVSATIAPAAGAGTNKALAGSNAAWWQWQSNGAVLLCNYVTFSPGNENKFRFTNSSNADITVLPTLVLDQGTFTGNTIYNSGFVIPAGGSVHVEASGTPAAGTGAIGPMVTITSGTQPLRGKCTFTVLSATANVSGWLLVASPTGVISLIPMQQSPAIAH